MKHADSITLNLLQDGLIELNGHLRFSASGAPFRRLRAWNGEKSTRRDDIMQIKKKQFAFHVSISGDMQGGMCRSRHALNSGCQARQAGYIGGGISKRVQGHGLLCFSSSIGGGPPSA